jgi:hypothetical protein
MAFCKSCGARFDWYRTNNGKNMPIDPEPSPDGNVRIDVVNNVATVVAPGSHSPLYVCHFTTCPGAGQHRRRA